MCGICGIFRYGIKEKVNTDDLKRMGEALTHRGPDDYGHYLNNGIGLAHRRLSIIDLLTGHQPIFNEDKKVVTVCNGEIYNFRLLKEALIRKGHTFYTESDTEVIVHLYEDLGEGFVSELRGMFAVAIWDENRKKLILARDRLGIKPLFYSLDNNSVLFASEIKSILQNNSYEKKIDYESLHNYLSFMTTSGVKTIFEGIYRLLPSEMLICSYGKIERKIYWEPDQNPSVKVKSLEDFYDFLLETIKSHLISDVPVGAFLSGGMDSSVVVALMSKIVSQPVKTFSIGFSGKEYYNELPYAKKIAEHFGTEHHEFIVTPQLVETVPKLIEFFDEPFAVSSALPTYFLAKFTSEKVKVVLTGDGADELMAGYYYRHLGVRLSNYFDTAPFLKKLHLDTLFRLLMSDKKTKIDKFFSHLYAHPENRYFRYLTKFQEEQKAQLYSEDLREITSSFNSSKEFSYYYHKCPDKDILNKWLYVDLKTTLPDEMLTKVDRMTMAFGLEARVPFLDHILVEYLSLLPSTLKLRSFKSKYILRKAMKDILPKEILNRGKHGFEVPIDDWIRDDLKDYVNDYLNEKRIKKEAFFNWEAIKTMLNQHWENKFNFGHQIWILLMFEVWHEKYFG